MVTMYNGRYYGWKAWCEAVDRGETKKDITLIETLEALNANLNDPVMRAVVIREFIDAHLEDIGSRTMRISKMQLDAMAGGDTSPYLAEYRPEWEITEDISSEFETGHSYYFKRKQSK